MNQLNDDSARGAAIRTLKAHPEQANMMIKWLELEHANCQSAVQWSVWSILIFFAGVIITSLSSMNAGESLRWVLSSNAALISAWAVVGVFFGILASFYQRASFFREQIKNIACKDTIRDGRTS